MGDSTDPRDVPLRGKGFIPSMDQSGSMKRSFAVVLEKDPEGGFIASVPALPGCFSQGETLAETRRNVKEAILLYLSGDDPGPLPEFVGVERVEVEA